MSEGASTFPPDLDFEKFLDFYHEKYDAALDEIALTNKRTLVIDFTDLYNFNEVLAHALIDNPDAFGSGGFSSIALQRLRYRCPEYADVLRSFYVVAKNLPHETPLREIGAESVQKLVQVSGIIVKATAVQPYILKAAWLCNSCGELILVDQTGDSISKPKACPTCDAKSRARYDLVPGESVFVDSQRLVLQETPEDIPPGQLPRSLTVFLTEDLVDTMRPGDRVCMTGVLSLKDPRKSQRTFDMVLKAHHIEASDYEDMTISAEDIALILKLSKDPELFVKMLRSMAPSIYGHERVKETILYQLFGGVAKERADIRIRGDINALLVGDPGTAKTQFLIYATKTAPRGLLTTGRGSSGAGLTASVTKESKTGQFVLEAGALVLGDRGFVGIDEIDKMKEEDRTAIHPAMEQQIVLIAKGGIVAKLNARTTILAAGNPVMGRYNPYQTPAQNINLPITILSRFDLIHLIRDIPALVDDEVLATHIVNIHRNDGTLKAPPIEPSLMRKYIIYAKKHSHPRLSVEAGEHIKNFYVTIRNASVEMGEASAAVSISARQLESMIRISEARARMHLRDEVLLEDAEAATDLMDYCLLQVGVDVTTGQRDIDILETGRPRGLQMSMSKVLNVIHDHGRIEGMVRREVIIETLNKEGMTDERIMEFIDVLRRDGTIYSPRPGYYKAVRST